VVGVGHERVDGVEHFGRRGGGFQLPAQRLPAHLVLLGGLLDRRFGAQIHGDERPRTVEAGGDVGHGGRGLAARRRGSRSFHAGLLPGEAADYAPGPAVRPS
jgi:hypothetical protein